MTPVDTGNGLQPDERDDVVAIVQRTRWGAVTALSLAVVLSALDMSIVAVALPVLGKDFAAPPAVTQWVMLAYLLPMVALAIPAGRWLDRSGLRSTFLLAVVGFGSASLVVAIAPALWMLLAGRALQGVFASLIGALAFPLVSAVVRPDQRGRAMGVVLTLIPLSGVAGPGLGGLLVESYGWRAVFLVNLPVGAAAIWLGLRELREGLPGARGLSLPDRALLLETVMLGGAVTALVMAMEVLGRGRGGIPVVAVVALVGAAAVGVVGWLRLAGSRALVTLLRRREFGLPVVATLASTTGVSATSFLVPYFVVDALHQTAEVAGVTLLAQAAGMAALSPLSGALADRVGPRPVALAGGAATVAGFLTMLTLGAHASPVDVAWRLIVIGVGAGLFASPSQATILAAIPRHLTATAGGLTALFRTLGFSLGPAVGALSWSLAPDGASGLRTGALMLTVTAAAGFVAMLAARSAAAGPTTAVRGEPRVLDQAA